MNETKFELGQPVTPLSRTLREGEMATDPVIKAVEKLEATNADLLAALGLLATAAEACDQHFNWEAQEFQPVEALWLRIRAAEARAAIERAEKEERQRCKRNCRISVPRAKHLG